MFDKLVSIGIDLTGERNVAALSKRTLQHARRLTQADTGLLLLREGQSLRLVMVDRDDMSASPDSGRIPLSADAEPISVHGESALAYVAATGSTLNISDVRAAVGPNAFPSIGVEVHSALVVPLKERTGQVLGVLALLNAKTAEGRVAPFDAAYEMPMSIVAAYAAIAIESTRSYEAAQEQVRMTTALLAVAQALSGRAPLEEMMRRVGREVARAVGADAVGAYFLDARKESLVPVAGYRLPKDLLEMFRRTSLVLKRWPGIQDAMRHRRVMRSHDARTDPRCDPDVVSTVPPHSALFAPTVARGESVGGLYILWWQTGRQFSAADVRLIEGVAAQVGPALEAVDLLRQTDLKLKESEMLLAASREASSSLDVGPLIRHFLRRIASMLKADGVGSYLLDDDGEWLVPLQGYRLPPNRLEALRALRLSCIHHAFYAEGVRTRRPVFSADAMNDARIPVVMREAVPHQSELFIPVVGKDRVVGAIIAAWWDRVGDISDLPAIEAIVAQAGVALDNVRLFQENRRQVKELSVLHALSRAVTGELDRRTLIEALHTQIALVLDARNLLILLNGNVAGEVLVALRIREGRREATSFDRRPLDQVGLAGAVMKTGIPVRTHDYAAQCARHRIRCSSDGLPMPHWVGVPMTAGDSVLGVVALASAEQPFTQADERLLTNIARLAALALRTARLFEERESAYSELYLLSLITHRALRRWHEGGEPER